MAEISADISAKKGSFWIEPLTAYSRVLHPFSRLLTSEKDPIADCLIVATVLKSADYLPDLMTEVWLLFWRLATMTINDLARFFQGPTGFALNTRRSLMRLCGNGLTNIGSSSIRIDFHAAWRFFGMISILLFGLKKIT